MKYSAFISYSHSTNKKFAESLHKSIEKHSKKWYQIRNIRVFIDKTSLSVAANLWGEIRPYLQESEYLIYLASRNASESHWVKKEIEWWFNNKEPKNIIIVLVDGDIVWDINRNKFNSNKTNSLPVKLIEYYSDEPLYIDLKEYNKDKVKKDKNFNEQVASIISRITGISKEELIGHHKKQKRIINSIIVLTFMVILIVSSLAIVSYYNSMISSANESNTQSNDAFNRKNYNKANMYSMKSLASAPINSTPHKNALKYYVNTKPYTIPMILKQTTNFAVGSIATSINGEYFAFSGMGSGENMIQYDIHLINKSETFYLKGNFGRVWRLKFSPNNNLLYASYADGMIRAWDLHTKKVIHSFVAYSSDPQVASILNFDISNDGNMIVYANHNADLIIRDTNNSKLIKKINRAHDNTIFSIKFSPSGKKILSTSSDGTLKSWDISKNYNQKVLYSGENIWTFTMTKDENKILLGLENGSLVALKLDNLTSNKIGKHQGTVFSLKMLPDSNIAVSTSKNGNVMFWDMDSEILMVELSAHTNTIFETAIVGNGEVLVTAGADKQIKEWNISGIYGLASFRRQKFSASHSYVAFSDQKYNVNIYEKRSDYNFTINLDEKITSIDISPNEEYFSIKTANNTLMIYSIKHKKHLFSLPASHSLYKDYMFIKSNELIWTNESQELKHMTFNSGIKKNISHNSHTTISSIAYSKISDLIFYADTKGEINVFDMNSGKIIVTKSVDSLEFKIEAINTQHFPIIFIGSDSTITVWDYDSDTYTKIPSTSPVLKILYSSDNDMIITSHMDGIVRIWDYKERKLEMAINLSPNKTDKISQQLDSDITFDEETQSLLVFSDGAVTTYRLNIILNDYKKISKNQWHEHSIDNGFDLYFDPKNKIKVHETPCPPYCTAKNVYPL